jgi:hypothetical protein
MPKGEIAWLPSTTMSFPTSKHQSQGYLPVSTLEENISSPRPRSDLEAPPKYTHLEDVDDQEALSMRPAKQRESWKKSLGTAFLVASVVYCVVWGFRGAFGRLRSPGCSGKHALPTSYTLPSGDKIPSVALGALLHAYLVLNSPYTDGLAGVWRAEKGKVGDAVKVRDSLKLGRPACSPVYRQP